MKIHDWHLNMRIIYTGHLVSSWSIDTVSLKYIMEIYLASYRDVISGSYVPGLSAFLLLGIRSHSKLRGDGARNDIRFMGADWFSSETCLWCFDPSIHLRRRCSRRMNVVKWSITHAVSSNSFVRIFLCAILILHAEENLEKLSDKKCIYVLYKTILKDYFISMLSANREMDLLSRNLFR